MTAVLATGWVSPSLPVSPKKLTAERLTAKIRDTIENNELGRRVQTMGQSIQSEDGLCVTVALVESYLESRTP